MMCLQFGAIFWCAILILSVASFALISAIVCVKGIGDLKDLLRALGKEKSTDD